jgi:hypothetical protein
MRHIFLAGHGNEGAEGWWLSDPPLEKGEQGGFDCVAGGFFVDRAVLRDKGSSVRQKISPRPSFSKRGNGFAM